VQTQETTAIAQALRALADDAAAKGKAATEPGRDMFETGRQCGFLTALHLLEGRLDPESIVAGFEGQTVEQRETRRGFTGKVLDPKRGEDLILHGANFDTTVKFIEWTGETALPRKGGAVARVALYSGFPGATDTFVAGELSMIERGQA
jgi:hypothetical protein